MRRTSRSDFNGRTSPATASRTSAVSRFMGHPAPGPGQQAGRVHIVHWKATWQDDMDLGFQGVEKIYPNGWWDIYPFLNGAYPFLTEDSITSRQTLNYSPA